MRVAEAEWQKARLAYGLVEELAVLAEDGVPRAGGLHEVEPVGERPQVDAVVDGLGCLRQGRAVEVVVRPAKKSAFQSCSGSFGTLRGNGAEKRVIRMSMAAAR